MANKKGGRPPRVLTEKDLEQIELLSGMMCSWDEIAAVLGWSKSTLEKKKAAKEAFARGLNQGKSSLKKAQYDLAIGGNPTMLIWLGKVHLNQKEEKVVEEDGKQPALVKIGARSE